MTLETTVANLLGLMAPRAQRPTNRLEASLVAGEKSGNSAIFFLELVTGSAIKAGVALVIEFLQPLGLGRYPLHLHLPRLRAKAYFRLMTEPALPSS